MPKQTQTHGPLNASDPSAPKARRRVAQVTPRVAIEGLKADPLVVHDDQVDIEPVVGNDAFDLERLVREESFMQEVLQIEIASSPDEHAMPYAQINCNGSNVVIPRGVPACVKRCYVEILARMKETKYSQVQVDPNRPDSLELRGRTGYAFPFQVIHDPNPRGREWLKHVMAEPV